MGLLTKLKSLLGLEDDRSQVRRGESGVTIEREPDESVEPDSETESAVKGVDTEESEDATESSGLHEVEEAEIEEAEVEEAEVEEAEPVETDATESEDAAETGISTEDVTTEPDEVDEAAEPGEATEPTTDAAEPDQTAADEPEPTPEETMVESEAEEAEATEEPIGEGEPLEDVKGIGSAYAERLRDAGVANVTELAKADADQLAEETGLSEKRISSWIDRAQAR